MNIFSNKIVFKNTLKKNIDNTYYYNIIKFLENIYISDFKDVNICFYFIDKEKPILKYFLENNKNSFNFFKLNVETSVKEDCLQFVKGIFNCEFKIKGYKINNNEMFIFINLTDDEKNNIGEWCIMDEICNKKKFLNDSICENVTNFFLNNPEFIYLRNKDNLKIEAPIVAYQNCNNLLELMYFKYNNNKTKFYYDYNNCKKKYLLRYFLFLSYKSIIFNKEHQYYTDLYYVPESVHE